MIAFKEHIPSFASLLQRVEQAVVSNDAYPQSYFKELMQHRMYYLNIYAFTLQKLFEAINKPATEVVLLDFGCGNGLLALFAKHCGVKEVHASDVNGSFVLAAQQLSKLISIEIDGWVIGDENTLSKHFAAKQLDAVIGTDVIEHVYDIGAMALVFKNLNGKIALTFTTASVAENPFKSNALKKLQLRDELEYSNALHSGGEYSGRAFLDVRGYLIAERFPQLDHKEVGALARDTRGLKKDDIYKAVEKYINENSKPEPPIHPTNTCDPITGSWTERLLTKDEYLWMFRTHGFRLKFYNGFYNEWQNGIKCAASKMLNLVIEHSGKLGEKISPFELLIVTPG